MIRKHQRATFLTILLCTALQLSSAQGLYPDSTIVVRFVGGSPLALEWMQSGRSGAISEFNTILGPHTSATFLQHGTLRAAEKALQRRKTAEQPSEQPPASLSALNHIAVLRYRSAIDPLMAARKLSQHPDVVYAEPLYNRSLVDAPNDSLAPEQYYLKLIQAPDAWAVVGDAQPVLVGIVDTGVDTSHLDLNANIYRNAGETGLDSLGMDRRVNGVDDDNNGFVDDWMGWDFAGTAGTDADNMPLPGNLHGTHVAGTVAALINNERGIAGVATAARVLAVKVGLDNPNSRSVQQTADGILYAAAMGCDVVNCSFGSPSSSFAELDVIMAATQLGALIVAASGNDGTDRAYYPASHEPVLSVTATNAFDRRAFFANVHRTVDVAAPGDNILATIPGNAYDYLDGTSMASPIAAAVAAMVKATHRNLSPQELHATVSANSVAIDSINPAWKGLMGTGRVNALSAVERRAREFATIPDVTFTDRDGNGIFEAGDIIDIQLRIANHLDELTTPSVELQLAPSTFTPTLLVGTVPLPPLLQGASVWAPTTCTIQLPADLPVNATLSLMALINNGTGKTVGRQMLSTTVNPSYRTLRANNVTVSVTSTGNIGYNDYPENLQGEGFRIGDLDSWLFEGAVLIGSSPLNLPNNARGADTRVRDDAFTARRLVDVVPETATAGLRATMDFSDNNDAWPLGLDIGMKVLQPATPELQQTLLVQFTLRNPSDTAIPNVHAALFFDWDVSPMGAEDGVAWDHQYGLAIHQHARRRDLPTLAVGMLSGLPPHFYAIDNPGNPASFGIYDHFLRSEKWIAMSSGIGRVNSTITDVSMVLGGGPMSIAPRDSQQIAFMIFAASDVQAARDHSVEVRAAAADLGFDTAPYRPIALRDALLSLEGGQVQQAGRTIVRFAVATETPIQLTLVDLYGRVVTTLVPESTYTTGTYDVAVTIPSVAVGTYFVQMATATNRHTMPIQVVP